MPFNPETNFFSSNKKENNEKEVDKNKKETKDENTGMSDYEKAQKKNLEKNEKLVKTTEELRDLEFKLNSSSNKLSEEEKEKLSTKVEKLRKKRKRLRDELGYEEKDGKRIYEKDWSVFKNVDTSDYEAAQKKNPEKNEKLVKTTEKLRNLESKLGGPSNRLSKEERGEVKAKVEKLRKKRKRLRDELGYEDDEGK